jgi:hypothetical protein
MGKEVKKGPWSRHIFIGLTLDKSRGTLFMFCMGSVFATPMATAMRWQSLGLSVNSCMRTIPSEDNWGGAKETGTTDKERPG